MKSIAADVLHITTLALNQDHPETEKIICDPGSAHWMIARCVPRSDSRQRNALYFMGRMRPDGKPTVVVQTPFSVDWSALAKDGILAQAEESLLDLAQFEEGSQVKIEVMATPTRNVIEYPWEGRVVTDPHHLAQYATQLSLNPDKVDRLYRKGLRWEWRLKDGRTGSKTLLEKHEEQITGEEECKNWFTKRAFAIRDRHNKPTDESALETLSFRMGRPRIFVVQSEDEKNGRKQTKTMKILAREYTAIAVIKNAEVFAERLANGIGRFKHWGQGCVRASLV